MVSRLSMPNLLAALIFSAAWCAHAQIGATLIRQAGDSLDPSIRNEVDHAVRMAAVWLVSAWEAGADAVLDGSPADLVVATGSGDIVVVPDPLGMAGPPAGSSAEWFFPADVRAMPDQLVLPGPDPGAVSGMSAEELSAAATDYAGRLGLRPGDRLATKLPLDHLEGVLAAIATPLAVGASVVYGDAAGEAPTATA